MAFLRVFPRHVLQRPGNLILALAIVAGLVGCKPSQEATTPTASGANGLQPVKLRLNWFPEAEHGGFYAALIHGYYKEQGLDVEIISGGRATPLAGELVMGRVEFAVANAEDVVSYRQQDADIVTVMTAAQHHPRCIMIRSDSGVKSLRDLKGLTLQVEAGQPYLEFMRKEGLLDGVTEVPYFNSVAQTVADPKVGQQAYVYAEPLVARQQGVEITTLMVSELGFDPYSSVLVTTGTVIEKQPELVRKMVAASTAGWKKYLAEPEETNAYILKQNDQGITAEALKFGVEILRPMCIPEGGSEQDIGQMTAERWRTLVDQMKRIDPKLADRVQADACYDLRFLANASTSSDQADGPKAN